MSDALFVNPRRLAIESYCAYGPVWNVVSIGGLAALVLPPLYKSIAAILSTPVVTTMRVAQPYLTPDMITPAPVWLFIIIGMLLTLVAKPRRRLGPEAALRLLPWEVMAGVPVFTYISWHVFKGALDPAVAANPFSTFWFLPLGVLAFFTWHAVYWVGIRAMVDLSWKDATEAVARQFIKRLGIPRERVFLVKADDQDYSVMVRGCFSDLEVTRLHMGLLCIIDYVTKLEVYGSRTASVAGRSAFAEHMTLARSRREAALARLERQKVASGVQDGLRLPWHERLLQHKYAGTVIMCLVVIWTTLLTFVLWFIGVLRVPNNRDIAIFFGARASGRAQMMVD